MTLEQENKWVAVGAVIVPTAWTAVSLIFLPFTEGAAVSLVFMWACCGWLVARCVQRILRWRHRTTP